MLLRVQLTTSTSQEPATLLDHLCHSLFFSSTRKLQQRCGLLMLISTWLYEYSEAIEIFMANDEGPQYLVSQLGIIFSKNMPDKQEFS